MISKLICAGEVDGNHVRIQWNHALNELTISEWVDNAEKPLKTIFLNASEALETAEFIKNAVENRGVEIE